MISTNGTNNSIAHCEDGGGGVAHEVHEGDDVDAVAEGFEGVGAAEVVQAGLGDVGEVGMAADDLAESGAGEAGVLLVGVEGLVGEGVGTVAEVAVELAEGFGAEVDGAGFVAFAVLDVEGAGFGVEVG